MKNWLVTSADRKAAEMLSAQCGLPPFIVYILIIRGFNTKESIMEFLSNDAGFENPFDAVDMDKAVERINRALDNYEKICVYGDYDADGVSSTALLCTYLETVGADVFYYIPSRENEGYGMNDDAVRKIHEKGTNLIITVDNGIAAHKQVDLANELGMDVVITDHHKPVSEEMPNAVAVVDLHRTDCPSKFKELSGVGVVLKLIFAMEQGQMDKEEILDNYCDIAAIGTIGDIVPLRGENRTIVKHGLNLIRNSQRYGINALIEASSLSGKKITAGSLAFSVVPRINAGGRLGESFETVNLLMTDDMQEAEEIARELSQDNNKRQSIEKEIIDEILKEQKKRPRIFAMPVIVVESDNWHQGVIGIAAARIKELFGKPVIVITFEGDTGKGSGRSVAGFSLCDAVFACSEYLTHCGGHPMAVGLGIKREQVENFREAINQYALSLDEMPMDTLNIDCKLNPAGISLNFVRQLQVLEPYGAGNPTPVFGLYSMRIMDVKSLSENKHLRITAEKNGTKVNIMKFFTAKEDFPFKRGDVADFAVKLDISEFSGGSVSIIAVDVRPENLDYSDLIKSYRIYENFVASQKADDNTFSYLMPTREEFAKVYRYIREAGGIFGGKEILYCGLGKCITFGKLCLILDVMKELNLISIERSDKSERIYLNSIQGKVNLSDSLSIKRLSEVRSDGWT